MMEKNQKIIKTNLCSPANTNLRFPVPHGRLCTCAMTPKAEQGQDLNKINSQNSVTAHLHSSGCNRCQQPMEFCHLHSGLWELLCHIQSQSCTKDCFSLIEPHDKSDCTSTKLLLLCIKLPIKKKKLTLLKLSSILIQIHLKRRISAQIFPKFRIFKSLRINFAKLVLS